MRISHKKEKDVKRFHTKLLNLSLVTKEKDSKHINYKSVKTGRRISLKHGPSDYQTGYLEDIAAKLFISNPDNDIKYKNYANNEFMKLWNTLM